jgi:hypothetical protein
MYPKIEIPPLLKALFMKEARKKQKNRKIKRLKSHRLEAATSFFSGNQKFCGQLFRIR